MKPLSRLPNHFLVLTLLSILSANIYADKSTAVAGNEITREVQGIETDIEAVDEIKEDANASMPPSELVIPIGQQGDDSAAIARPKLGLSSAQVREQFGEPQDWSDPVGQPPITTWQYADFSVYFEYDKVIHSVLKHKPQQ